MVFTFKVEKFDLFKRILIKIHLTACNSQWESKNTLASIFRLKPFSDEDIMQSVIWSENHAGNVN